MNNVDVSVPENKTVSQQNKSFPKLNRTLFGLLICLIICVVYFCLSNYITTNIFSQTARDYYTYQLDAFFHGRVYVTPPASYDLSVFQGRKYLYWGPAPVLFILPFYLISHLQASDVLYTLFGGASNVVLFYLAVQAFKKYFGIPLSLISEAFLVFSFGLASPNFVLSLTGQIWFTSQIFATTYLLLFYLFYFTFLNEEKNVYFVLSVVFFYLTCLSRYSLLFNGLLFFFIFFHYRFSGRRIPSQILWLFGLLTCVFVGLGALYNYLKFQNILETGQRYQEGSPRYDAALKSNHILSLHYVWYNIYYYFLHPIHFSSKNQFVVIDPEGNSVFSVYPALLLLAGLFIKRPADKKRLVFLLMAGGVIGLSVVFLMLYFATGWVQFGNRYFFDTIPLLFLLLTFVLNSVPTFFQLLLLCYGIFVNYFGTLVFYGK